MVTGCGNAIENGGTNATLADCNLPCAGDVTEFCGAGSEFQDALPNLLELLTGSHHFRPAERLLERRRTPAAARHCALRWRLAVPRVLQVRSCARVS